MSRWIALAILACLFGAGVMRGQGPPPGMQQVQAHPRADTTAQSAEDPEDRDGGLADKRVVAYAQRLTTALARAAGVDVTKVHVTRTSKWYAILEPDGQLFVSSGLLRQAGTEAELAGLLAHPLGHRKASAATAPGQPADAAKSPVCVLAVLTSRAPLTDPQRQAEIAATRSAMEIMRNAGFSPSALVDVLRTLTNERPELAAVFPPSDLQRLQMAMASEPIPAGGYVLDSTEFPAMHERLVAAMARPAIKKASPELLAKPTPGLIPQ